MKLQRRLARYRSALLALAITAMSIGQSSDSLGEAALVPPGLQARLLAKVAAYDRKFAERAGPRARLLLVQKADDPESVRLALEMKNALAGIAMVGDLPHDEEIANFTDAPAIANLCRSQHAAVVYFSTGLGRQIPSIRAALTFVNILSVAGDPEYVRSGIVLGFNLVSGNPKLIVNLGQARAQHVAFDASVLRLMTVYGAEE